MLKNKISELISTFKTVRAYSLELYEHLDMEDVNLQASEFVSPPKWHLAHTTWFFETFILKEFLQGYQALDSRYEILFNSYYNSVGDQFSRPHRGLLTRPLSKDVLSYRRHVDAGILKLVSNNSNPEIIKRMQLGLNHEQQHQELLLTDIKYSFSRNPTLPAFSQEKVEAVRKAPQLEWLEFSGGLAEVGINNGDEPFFFDNESPSHTVFLPPFQMANRLVTNGEFMEFVLDDGYKRPEFWLSDGWQVVQKNGWDSPLYWHEKQGIQQEFTLYGPQPWEPNSPVTHLSLFEADAFASWSGARLPTEFEWEFAVQNAAITPEMPQSFHPQYPTEQDTASTLCQPFGTCWQWTSSAYRPYPGFRVEKGAIGEYNGKFMCNQWVLRGSSCATSTGHARTSYRNFFYPQDRWQFTGLRLAKDLV